MPSLSVSELVRAGTNNFILGLSKKSGETRQRVARIIEIRPNAYLCCIACIAVSRGSRRDSDEWIARKI